MPSLHLPISFFHAPFDSINFAPVKFFSLSACLFLAILPARSESVDTIIDTAKRAMASDLWSVASSQLRVASTNESLFPEDRTKISILLAETLIRDNQPSQAIAILDLPEVAKLPNAKFWKGQALAGTGFFKDATSMLLDVANNTENDYFAEAALTAASLQLSLSEPEEALKTLVIVSASENPTHRAHSILRRSEILIELHRYTDARALLSTETSFPAPLKPMADFLDASLSLEEADPTKAATLFSNLLANPKYQSLTQYSLAAIGKADALAAQDSLDLATETLISFLRERPDSPLMSRMFNRIIDWLPSEILTTEHPTLTSLSEWIPATSPEPTGLINTRPDTSSAAWPSKISKPEDISIFALYAKAIGLHRIDNPSAKQEARHLLRRLRILAPNHHLTPRSLMTLAKWNLEAGDTDGSFAILETLRQNAKSPTIQGEAAFNSANIAYSQGDLTLAASLFEQASTLLSGINGEAALLNSNLARIENSGPTLVQHQDPAVAEKLNAELSLERALSNNDPSVARSELDTFLQQNPNHPRATEARIAIIEAALASSPPDLSLANAQIETLKNTESPLPDQLAPRLALAELRMLDASNQPEQTVKLATELSERFPNTPTASEASLIMGKSLFRSGNYNQARLVLEKLATAEPGTQRSQAALLLAARSAALGATTQSREEALTLFDKTIAINGPLSSLAVLEKARLLIDLNRLPAAIESLEETYKKTAPDDPSYLPTGLLLGEAIYANGDSNPEGLSKALEIYDTLLKSSKSNSSQFYRLQYLRGLTLEKLPDMENPEQTRIGDALSTYYSVLDRPTDPPPPEWDWFERSGFRALALLENAGKWKPAISIADKIASFGGPRAEEAATRARQMRLKHMIWED